MEPNKKFVVHLDILGFDEIAKQIDKIHGVPSWKARKNFIEKVDGIIKTYFKDDKYSNTSPDSWMFLFDTINSALEFLKNVKQSMEIDYNSILLETSVTYGDVECDEFWLTDEAILAAKICDKYRKLHRNQNNDYIRKSFTLIHSTAYKGLNQAIVKQLVFQAGVKIDGLDAYLYDPSLYNSPHEIAASLDESKKENEDIGELVKVKPTTTATTLAEISAEAIVQATWVDVRGEVYDGQASGHIPHTDTFVGWDAYNSAGFWYDLKEGKMSEVMTITNDTSALLATGIRTIAKDKLFYNSTMQIIQYKVNKATNNSVDCGLDAAGVKQAPGSPAGYYGKLGWFGQPYVALNGKPNKLAQLIIEQGTSSNEKKSLAVGETWDIGGGWTLTAQSIDAKASPRQAWLVLSKDGIKKDDRVISQGEVYTYTEKSIAGESDVPLFVTYLDRVFAGATSDRVQLRYTWAISTNITLVQTSDIYGVFKVTDDGTGPDHTIKLWNDEGSVSLSPDSTVNLAGQLHFHVVDNSTVLRFYPLHTMVQY